MPLSARKVMSALMFRVKENWNGWQRLKGSSVHSECCFTWTNRSESFSIIILQCYFSVFLFTVDYYNINSFYLNFFFLVIIILQSYQQMVILPKQFSFGRVLIWSSEIIVTEIVILSLNRDPNHLKTFSVVNWM